MKPIALAEFAFTAGQYHGGQGSMLYAVASTGELALGTIRPSEPCTCHAGCRTCGGEGRPGRVPLSDVAWRRDLVERLSGEASCAADDAESNADDDSAADLRGIVEACDAWLATHPEVMA